MTEKTLTSEDRERLLDVADRALAVAVECGELWDVDPAGYSAALRERGASFVTLRIGPELRGCIGSMRAGVPLVCDVAQNAYSAAFRDPRFPPLNPREHPHLSVSVSVLTEPETVPVSTEIELLELMSGRSEGWVLRCGGNRGLLLPSVWQAISEPAEFLAQLKLKAALPRDYWSEEVVVERFTASSFSRTAERRRLRFAAE